jgi:hypothetical protein
MTYTAVCERVGEWWEITVPELDEMTQARHLDDVPATVADLVALMTGADQASVEVDVQAHAEPPFSWNLGVRAARLIGSLTDFMQRLAGVKQPR